METKAETQDQDQPQAERLDQVADIISSNCKWGAAAGFIPLPYLDIAGLAAVQVKMINELAKVYGKTVKEESVRTAVAALLGSLATAGLAAPVAMTTLKIVPVLGVVAGGISMGALGAAATYAVGKVFVNHFEGGGSLADFDAEKVKEDVKSAFASKTAKA